MYTHKLFGRESGYYCVVYEVDMCGRLDPVYSEHLPVEDDTRAEELAARIVKMIAGSK